MTLRRRVFFLWWAYSTDDADERRPTGALLRGHVVRRIGSWR